MILYGMAASPFVQRVVLAARIKGHALAITPPPGGALDSAAFAALSPMRRIPLLDDDGVLVCESAAIVAHLDETLPGAPLLSEDRAARARARSIAQLVDVEFAAALRPFVMQKIFGQPSVLPVLEAARTQMARGLDAIETLLDRAGPWAAGAAPGVADCALVPLLVLAGLVETVAGEALLGERPALDAYGERAFADPLGAQVRTDMLGAFAAIRARRQQEAQQQQ